MGKRLGFTQRQKQDIRITIGSNLAAARRNAGMSQTDVMRAVWGVSNNRNRISEIENGKKDLSLLDLLIFQELYGQSLDYICGLSTEPEVDMLAGTVNHVVNQSKNLIELMTSELSEVVVNHLKTICQNDHEALVNQAKVLCQSVKEGQSIDESINAANALLQVIKHIEVKQARQQLAIDTQMMQIKERIDKQDRHKLLSEIDGHYQYSLPLPKPIMAENIQGVD
ncbi:helix-turn-helix domain-containing protein [Psychrobacter sp. I-STPA10]|uniref:helix-turn-helix domain-containing protein n=1 Tax=Psychrobacter sp. I-STPA10 TaxID=2585769 RepID=UPI001E53D7E9|nr:helix-turn-helix transcriptional regulator [Psychrobacter sp. I-STPA10]